MPPPECDMRKSVVLLLGTFSLFAGFSHADDGDDDAISAKEVKTLFFGHDDRTRVTDPTAHKISRIRMNSNR